MEDALHTILSITSVFVLVLANGFFVAVEFAMVRARETRLKSPEMSGKFGVKSSLKLLGDLDASLSATQLGITLASLLLGWWGEHTFQRVLFSLFTWLGETYALVASHAVATVFALLMITFLHIVIGELAAKSIAIRYPETTMRFLADLMYLFSNICKPAVVFLNGSANLLLKVFGFRIPSAHERVHSSAELAMLISESGAGGVLDEEEEHMLQGVFAFSGSVAREVMTPRTDLVTIAVDAAFEEVLQVVNQSGLSRFPVVGPRIDDVLGVLLVKDILPFVSSYLDSGGKDFDVSKIMRECYFIPGTKPSDDLLAELKGRKLHIAVVLDEHGGVAGVVTLEDLLEEIVGDIFDESDVAQDDIVEKESGEIIVDGGVLVSDLNARFDLQIPEGDYDTIAGFILTVLGRVPDRGDHLVVDHSGNVSVGNHKGGVENQDNQASKVAVVTVEKVDSHRVERVTIARALYETISHEHESSLLSNASEPEKALSGGK